MPSAASPILFAMQHHIDTFDSETSAAVSTVGYHRNLRGLCRVCTVNSVYYGVEVTPLIYLHLFVSESYFLFFRLWLLKVGV